MHEPRRTKREPARADELGLIRGVTRVIERRLRACGVHTFRQLGEMTAGELAARLKQVRGASAKRIEQQDWIGQARDLAAQTGEVAKRTENSNGFTPNGRLRNQSFVVDLFLDSAGAVHLMHVLHLKTNQGEAWHGWDASRLADFLTQQANARVPAGGEAPLVAADADRVPDGVHLRSVEVAGGNGQPLERRERFAVTLRFDLCELMRATKRPLAYRAVVRARRKPDGSESVVAETTGRLTPTASAITVPVTDGRLDPGIYSFRADLAVTRPGEPGGIPLRGESSMPAGLFQVV